MPMGIFGRLPLFAQGKGREIRPSCDIRGPLSTNRKPPVETAVVYLKNVRPRDITTKPHNFPTRKPIPVQLPRF